MSVYKMGQRRRGRENGTARRPRSRENVFTIRRTARPSAPAVPAKKKPPAITGGFGEFTLTFLLEHRGARAGYTETVAIESQGIGGATQRHMDRCVVSASDSGDESCQV